MIDTKTLTEDVFNTYVQEHYVKELDKTNKKIYLDSNDRKIGIKGLFNYWKLFQYDSSGNKTYVHDSDGNWEKRKYRDGVIIQFSNSSGTYWTKND